MHDRLASVSYSGAAAISVRYAIRSIPEAWVLPEDTVPESIPHDDAAEHLKLLLRAWSRRVARPLRIARNLAIRWLEQAPRIGIDPDVCVLDPPPPDVERLSSLCLWKLGHAPPPLCIEVVSAGRPYKDYATVQDRYAAIGARELIIFDPMLAGPASLGGPVALQLWRLDTVGVFERVHFSDEPCYSRVLGAWFLPQGCLLEIADDAAGEARWLTDEEQARHQAEQARHQAEQARHQAEQARHQAERERTLREELEQRLRKLEK